MWYRAQEGMVAWTLHRVTGIAVALFLLVHIADIMLIHWGPNLFNKLLFLYHAMPFRVGEVALLAAVLFHALNGIRIILIDFSHLGARCQRGLFYGELGIFAVVFVPSAYVMLTSS